MTRYCINNWCGRQPIPRNTGCDPLMLHYCYGDSVFNKRDYDSETSILAVWHARADPGSIHGTLCAAIQAAARYYGYHPG